MAEPKPNIAIRGGRVIDPANDVDEVRDVYVSGGRVVSFGQPPGGFEADEEIDAGGKIVCPGFVDLCARLREPGHEHKASIASETAAAAAAGITTLCCPPDTDPVIDTPAVAQLVQQRAERAGYARVAPLGALTQGLEGELISEMAALRDAGCVGVTNVEPLRNTQILRRAMEYAATFDLTVFLTPVDPWLHNDGCAHEGPVATRLGLPGVPTAAETAAVARDLALVMQTGVRAHFGRLSTAQAVRMIARAQYDGVPVTADVSAHHLFLTEQDIGEYDSACHVQPPLRTHRDLEGLRDGVVGGTLSAVCSDHQPHEPDGKLAPFSSTEPGVSGLETLLALMLRLVDEGALTLNAAIARLTAGPAGILGLEAGTLSAGSTADLCILDPDAAWQVDATALRSQGHNTPFDGWALKGRVHHTVHGGRMVYDVRSRETAVSP